MRLRFIILRRKKSPPKTSGQKSISALCLCFVNWLLKHASVLSASIKYIAHKAFAVFYDFVRIYNVIAFQTKG